MKRNVATVILGILICATSFSQQTPRWLRQSAISPDGSTVAFVYQGDIYTVPASGGRATQITTNPAHDTEPLWSPDGKTIVFASVREGSKDLWAIPAEGGTPVRLTTYGGKETPLAISPDGLVYFSANIQEDAVSSIFPGENKVYSVNLQAIIDAAANAEDDTDPALMKVRKPVQLSSICISNLSINSSGTIIYEDWKGYEDPFRKHHTSSVTRDIWKLEGGKFTKLTSFVGEDRNPVFAPGGNDFYYLSEQNTGTEKAGDWAGDLNIWKGNLAGGSPTRITDFKDNPVRYLSISQNGILCFSWNGDLYTLRPGSTPVKLNITLNKDKSEKEHILRSSASGARDLAISPNGKEIAIVARGEVYTTTLELGDTKQITKTAEQERGVSFGKDGKTLYYASERGGEWGIYKATLSEGKDKFFTFSHKIKEERFTPEGQTCFQPVVSPDGKWVAYLRDRTELVIKPTSGGKEKVLLEKGTNYSYSDGDIQFAWSPDSKHILCSYQGGGRMYNEDVALINIADGTLTDLTESGYSDVNFHWALGGKAMTWESDKAGYRSHGSWGAEGDVYAMFFDDEAFTKFKKDKDVIDIEKLLKDEGKKKKKDEADSTKKEEKVESFKMELERRADRIVKLTPNPGRLGDHYLSPDGDKLYYSVQLEKGRDLCCLDIKKGSVKVVSKGVSGSFVPAPDGKSFFVLGSQGIDKIEVASGNKKSIGFRAEYEYFPAKERQYIFEHCWKQVDEKFYDPDMHGVDWAAQKANYEQFLPYITDNYAFQELLSEMLGELNGSHTGGRYRDGTGIRVGHLGVLFDNGYNGKGLKIKEILPGSLLLAAYPELKEGDIITAIDSEEIPEGQQWYDALAHKAGKRILLTIKGKKEKEVYVRPSASDSDALYKRWVRANEKRVEELSGGKIGYVHVKGMNSPSFREVYSNALGKYRNCDALIVDTRNNGGGWLHNDLATFLNGQLYTLRQPRGVYMAPEPYDKWVKPSCVLVCENDYSDACGFPYVYRSLEIGKIIGAPVPGTATSVWWETQQDPTLIFGIPQVGSYSIKEGRYLENLQLEPDILVYNDPESVEKGEDKQLEAAVAEMLRQTAGSKNYK